MTKLELEQRVASLEAAIDSSIIITIDDSSWPKLLFTIKVPGVQMHISRSSYYDTAITNFESDALFGIRQLVTSLRKAHGR